MGIEDLTDEEGEISGIGCELQENISEINPRELAYRFKTTSDETKKIIYREFCGTQSEEYQQKFNRALEESILGERDDPFEG